MRFSGVLITNFMLVLIADDFFVHLGQVGSGQVRSTIRRPVFLLFSIVFLLSRRVECTIPNLTLNATLEI